MVTWQICAVWGAPGVGPCLLGPILFLLCTADLLRRVRLPSGAACLCGLDDLRICNKCGPAVVYLQDGVSACMGDVACWTAADQLRLSCTGSEVLIVWGSIPCRALLTLIQALVVSKVDYCNSVLAGVSDTLLRRLQSALNAAAWLVFSARKSEHFTPLLCELHWLRVPEKIKFWLCIPAFR